MSIKAVIRRNGLRQNDIAADLGIAEETLSRWANGAVAPSAANLVRLAEYLRRYEPALKEGDLLEPDAVDIPVATVVPGPEAA